MGDPAHTPETLALADLRFHLSVIDAARNPFMRTVGSLIEAALAGIFKLSSPAADQIKIGDVAASHMRIVEEIRRRDEDGARRAMETVIRVGRNRLTDTLARKQP
jgi:DNA-binding FadR family transcriptional regulator